MYRKMHSKMDFKEKRRIPKRLGEKFDQSAWRNRNDLSESM